MNAVPTNFLEALVSRWRAEARALTALRPLAEQLGQREAEMLDNCAEAYTGVADELEQTYKSQ